LLVNAAIWVANQVAGDEEGLANACGNPQVSQAFILVTVNKRYFVLHELAAATREIEVGKVGSMLLCFCIPGPRQGAI
jgi:hypothetical protein